MKIERLRDLAKHKVSFVCIFDIGGAMKMYYESHLYHHGILGQHWGKRNGPPYPLDRDGDSHSSSEKQAGWRKSLGRGSYKSTGASSGGSEQKKKRGINPNPELQDIQKNKMHYDVNSHGINPNPELQDIQKNKAGRVVSSNDINNYRSAVNDVDSALNSLGKMNHQIKTSREQEVDLSTMSDADLKNVVNRMNLEQQYNDLAYRKVSNGKNQVDRVLAVAGTVTAGVSTSLALCTAINKFRHKG